jgi:hypothetical protein
MCRAQCPTMSVAFGSAWRRTRRDRPSAIQRPRTHAHRPRTAVGLVHGQGLVGGQMCAGADGGASAYEHCGLGVFEVGFVTRLADCCSHEAANGGALGCQNMLSRCVLPADSLKGARAKGMGPLSRPPDRSLLLVAQNRLGAPRRTRNVCGIVFQRAVAPVHVAARPQQPWR